MSISHSSTDTYLYDGAAVEAQQILRGHVARATRESWGERTGQPLTLIKQAQEEMVGFVCGFLSGGWLNLELLWVEPPYRLKGIGRGLLAQMEDKAASHGMHSAYLWTQEFEAPEFYRHHGYREFATLPEFNVGHQLIGMKKQLLPLPL